MHMHPAQTTQVDFLLPVWSASKRKASDWPSDWYGVAAQGLPDHIFRDHLLQHPSPGHSQEELGDVKVNINDDMWKLLLEVREGSCTL